VLGYPFARGSKAAQCPGRLLPSSGCRGCCAAPRSSQPLYPDLVLGSLVSVLPMLILFPFLQKYVARGL